MLNGAITSTDSYNARMQPVFLSASTSSQTVLSLGYDFTSCTGNGGNNGNVCRLVNNKDGSRSQSFQYDALNRLLSANSGNWSQSYSYDNWGNLLAKNAAGGDTPLNVSVNGKNRVTSWCYDAAGNIINPNLPCGGPGLPPPPPPTNMYDSENRLTWTGSSGGGTGTFFDYDADGQRVRKLSVAPPGGGSGSGTLYWHGSGGEVLQESDLNGVLKNEYVFFGGKRVARYNPANGYSYYFSDHLGSADVVTDASGNIKEESDFYPFGGERVVTDLGLDNRYKFTGKERDPETGCDYFGARYYCNPIGWQSAIAESLQLRQEQHDDIR